MRNWFLFLPLSVIVLSCGLSEVGNTGLKGSGNLIWGGPPGNSAGGGTNLMPVCYMTAADYAKGYDWRADVARETVRCSLVVYADGITAMKVPAGESYEISSDPDMHRIVGGHLYTDYSSSGETIIKKNGTFLFSYPAEEHISDMRVIGEDVFTLGEARSGDGFSFRKNGLTKVFRENGSLIGSLKSCGDSLTFTFCEEIRSAEGSHMRYYSVNGSKVSQIALRDDIVRVWDAMQIEDEVIYIATLTGVPQPVVVMQEKMYALNMPKGATMISCSMFRLGQKTGVEGLYRTSAGVRNSALWINGECVETFAGLTISALCTEGDGIFCVMNPPSSSSQGSIYRAGEIYEMPRGYACMGNQSLAVVGGIMYVGLSSYTGENPLLWKDGQTTRLNVNGYISSLTCDGLQQETRVMLPRSMCGTGLD